MHTTTRRRRSLSIQQLAELERRRERVQANIDAAELDTTTPAELNEWLALRVLIDRSISRLRNEQERNPS